MKRRRYLTAFGTLAGAASLVFSSSAFTTVSAERPVAVKTADDNDAFLRLEERGDGTRSIDDGSTVKFSFPGLQERVSDQDLGLGSNSIYEFDRDTDESSKSNPTEGLLRIGNQGTQPVDIYSKHQTDNELEIELYDVTDSSKTALRDDPVTLNIGEHVDVGFRIRTFDADVKTFDETLTIVGEAPG